MPVGIRNRKLQRVGGAWLGDDHLWDPQEMWAEGKGGCNWCSVAALGTRLMDQVLGNRET